ncbi:MAG: hypothetical protein ACKPKO_04435, partial [Candidatus Fonsibacter sp.]
MSATATKKALATSVEPVVILAANEREFEQSERIRRAIGNRTNITTVVLDTEGPDEVLMVGEKGPVKAKAQVVQAGVGAPVRPSLHSAMKDDAP